MIKKGECSGGVPGRPVSRELPDRGDREPPKKFTRATKDKADAKESEAHRVYLWRLEKLEEAGMPKELAKSCAGDDSIDLHIALDMLSAGRSPASISDMLSAL